MMDREKVIKGLECCQLDVNKCKECPYLDKRNKVAECGIVLHNDALALLKKSFTPEEVYKTVIEYGQHDMRFRLGDRIDYTFTDVIDILNNELMCKAGDM